VIGFQVVTLLHHYRQPFTLRSRRRTRQNLEHTQVGRKAAQPEQAKDATTCVVFVPAMPGSKALMKSPHLWTRPSMTADGASTDELRIAVCHEQCLLIQEQAARTVLLKCLFIRANVPYVLAFCARTSINWWTIETVQKLV
jgi:hypothetical protein